MFQMLVRKLENYVQFGDLERRSLLLIEAAARQDEPRQDIVLERDPVSGALLLLEGMAYRYKTLPDGRRQILGYMIPGDMCDPRVILLDRRDHSIASLSRVRFAFLSRADIIGLMTKFRKIGRGFWLSALIDDAIAREWLVSLGQRSALERLSHLICELYYRLEAVGLIHGNGFDFPVTQAELGDTLGLTAVHVNRTLQEIRRQGLVRTTSGRLTVLDLQALSTIAMFDPGYLYLNTSASRRAGRGPNPALAYRP